MVLEWAIGTPARYIGMIGSKTKVKTIFAHLLDKGVTQKKLDSVYSPIGLEIGAQTPEEIAVSILAEIIKVRRSA
jgi:xanthine dehydrogenase accessory factor